MTSEQTVKKFCGIIFFLLTYPLCLLLGSLHGGDSNRMPQYTASRNDIEKTSDTHHVLLFI